LRSFPGRGALLSRNKNCEDNPMHSRDGAAYHPEAQDVAWLDARYDLNDFLSSAGYRHASSPPRAA
jgi:hypothetical protein